MIAVFGVNFDGSVFVKWVEVDNDYGERFKEDKGGIFSAYVASFLGPFPEIFTHVSTQQQVQLKMDLVLEYIGGESVYMVYIDSS